MAIEITNFKIDIAMTTEAGPKIKLQGDASSQDYFALAIDSTIAKLKKSELLQLRNIINQVCGAQLAVK